jgi:hypothetical protein
MVPAFPPVRSKYWPTVELVPSARSPILLPATAVVRAARVIREAVGECIVDQLILLIVMSRCQQSKII